MAKRKSTGKRPVTMTLAQLRKIQEKEYWRGLILFIATAMDEFDWTEDEVEAFATRMDRYASAIEDHTISLKKVSQIIEQVMGMKIYLD